MEGVEDIPGAALHEGLAWNWKSFAEYLDAVDEPAARHRRRRPGAPRRAAPARDGRARRRPRGRHRRRHRRDGRLAARGRSRPAPSASPRRRTLQPPHRRRASYTPTLTAERPTSWSGSPKAIGAAGTGVLQVVSDFLDVDDEFAMLPPDGRAVGPAAVDLARPQPDAARPRSAASSTASPRRTPTGCGCGPGRAARHRPDPRAAVHAQPVHDRARSYREIADLPLAERVALLRDPEVRSPVLQSADERSRTSSAAR